MSSALGGGYRHIVRIAETDIQGDVSLAWGLARVKGIGYNMAIAICRKLGLDPNMLVGYLRDEDVAQIEELIKNPIKYGIPSWMLNRRKDYETGVDMHLVSSELIYYARQDIEREIRIRSWKGVRHSLGYKVRGQKTHTTGRVGPVVGVQRKKAAQQQQK
ncbi:30S ribosomal protein S13 [Ignisphaera sp. 4213-co]|uniref:Small ribosomal subunit protein uS13 n=1 Tax=Ignisphaera cupida TaxID=3050454 RepID=A0ABD4Z6G4_9CREN|nr:30S ribosomal protein S13 [Ignisphaera sp. 4213-co]MDK6028547.1 30S ribosomal protein S13 [Ignisphaera sp. 4213-co]